jgi:hypothetical protein
MHPEKNASGDDCIQRQEERMMNQPTAYFIRIRGQMSEIELNAISPTQVTAVRIEAGSTRADSTRFSVCTDQSGLVGLLRLLHGRGMVLISVDSELGSFTQEEK